MRRLIAVLTLPAALLTPTLITRAAQAPTTLDDVVNALPMRNIGAFRTGAWVTAIAVPESPAHDHLYTIYAASRSGGLWKTANGGITWDNVTDGIGLEATGAVAIAPSDPNTVWVGGGDQAIARIAIHPTNPNIVYVAALGHLFSRNEERGVFRTVDGGKTWTKVLYVDDGVGAV